MNKPQFIETPGGERLVVLPECEYQRLLGAGSDEAMYDSAKARLAEDAERVPAAIVEALVAGENPIRVWRRHRGSTLEQLAAKSGLSPAYLSQLETGKRQGTLSVLRRLAQALGLELADLAS
ncbi:MAG TPA: helix-turn-helix transcriptional regulator [Afifellaceae bacterium]|nr:helix-turn-helix transcriptional regulator [Afifellaceae bacterium]